MRLVVFDLDGTITRRDTLLPYVLAFLARRPWRAPGLLMVLPTVCRFALGRADHGELKAALITRTLRGASREDIQRHTSKFVRRLLARGLFADARARIERHRREGDRLVLMSASPDLYVPELAAALSFAEPICTGVAWNESRLSGELSTPNCRGAEKLRQFLQLRARNPGLLTVAYGNDRSDLAHLQVADHGVLVNGSPRARRAAAAARIEIVRWR